MRQRVLGVAVGALCALLALPASADRLPDRRAPVISSSGDTGQSAAQIQALRDSLADLLQRIEELQSQIARLQNQSEMQAHSIDELKNAQRQFNADIDKRVTALEQKAAAPPPPPPPPPAATAPPPVDGAQQKAYDTAFSLLKKGSYAPSVKAFSAFVAKYPHSPLAGNAEYWIGEAQYVLRNRKAALAAFGAVIHRYPKNGKVPNAMLRQGVIQQELGETAKARKTYETLRDRFPDSDAAQAATKRLKALASAKKH